MTAAAPLPRTFWILWTGTLVNRLGSFVVPFLGLYLTEQRHLSTTVAGAIASLYGAGNVAAGMVGGVLADRWGRRATMLASLFGGSATMLAFALARTTAETAAVALLAGFVIELYRPAVGAVVADVVPPEERLRAYGLLYWAVNIGFSVAPFVAGYMARRSFLALFIADAATTLIYGVIVWAYVPETRPATSAASHPGPLAGLGKVFADRVFMTFFALSFLIALVFYQSWVALSIDMRAHGHAESTFGTVIAVNGVLIVALQPFAGRALGRFRRSRVLAAAALLTGLGFGLNAVVAAAPLYALAVAIWTLGEIAGSPTSSSIVADLAPADLRGRYQGVFGMSWGLASFLGPTLGAFTLDHAGGAALWGGCLVLGVAVAAGHLAAGPARRARLRGTD